jgi:predicted small lipoprotein YifL
MHISTFKFILAILLASVALTGCATQTPILDQHFGDAVNAAKAQQIINPDASQNTDPVAGIDGQAANASVDRYHKSFVQPPATTNIFNIGVGTGSNTGASGGMR